MLKIEGIQKRFKNKEVLKGVNLDLGEGRVCGLLGLNGAGKSTLMKIACGLTRADEGMVTINGKTIDLNHPSADVGAMIEEPAFYGDMTGWQNLEYFRSLCPSTPKERVGEVLRVAGIEASGGQLYRKYSQGMKQRLYFACALLKKPSVLILDEPFSNIDPVSVKLFEDVIKSIAKAGNTVLISGHIIAELKNVCDCAAILDEGIIKSFYDDLSSVDLEKEFLTKVSGSGDAL